MSSEGVARVGCSGWVYKHWRGPVYWDLPAKKWFGRYAEMFDTVEINNSFYRLPSEGAAEGWAAQAPPGFVYALKLGQFGSHRMKLKDASRCGSRRGCTRRSTRCCAARPSSGND